MFTFTITELVGCVRIGLPKPWCGAGKFGNIWSACERHDTQYAEWRMNFMFCWPCIIVNRYSETNVTHFSFNLLRIKGLYMFWALLAHPHEAHHKRKLVYCLRVMSVGCTRIDSILVQPTYIIRKQYTKSRLSSASWGWASNIRNM
jgi:hypothetical protein